MHFALGLLLGCLTFAAVADDFADTRTKLTAALEHERRPAADLLRDENRKPVETLEFFGLRDDMKVLELIPGGGWYTRLLAPTLEEKGTLYVSMGAERAYDKFKDQPGFTSLELIAFDATNFTRDPGPRSFRLPAFSFGIKDLDMALTFRNVHNFTAESRGHINKAVFDALKPGGLYGVVDHTQRHMQPLTNELRRRADPVNIIKEIQAAGFVLVDFSDLHFRPDDELRYEVGRKTVAGNTDRFTLLFRKP